MYRYDAYDQRIVNERVAQYRDQTRRYLAGELTEDEFRPLRLQNGLYIQRHAPMLRVADSVRPAVFAAVAHAGAHRAQVRPRLRATSRRARTCQFNWPALEIVPDILADLATVEMHAIQTSGNCIRNITTDQFAGVAPDEVVDPRPWAEILRQWSTFHPEFAFLPRKFKIAVCGSQEDRAVILLHDIGLQLVRNEAGELGFRVFVGGGMGRTPIIGSLIREFIEWQHIATYCEAMLRVYNRYGRRDNAYKARIKILVKALDAGGVRAKGRSRMGAPEGWSEHADAGGSRSRMRHSSPQPAYEALPALDAGYRRQARDRQGVRRLGQAQRACAQAAGLCRGHAVAEEDRRAAGRRHRRADGRWWPIWPSATASANCACRTSRI